MGLGHRSARQHETQAIHKNAVDASVFADFRENDRVMTVDGYPGIVASVNDGPYPGTESYDVVLDGGLGGGEYTAGQLSPINGTTASHEHEAVGQHMAHDDYPELGSILYDRPPIERIERYATRGDAAPFVHTVGEDYHNIPAFEAGHKDAVYLRFGKWRADERSGNNVTGEKEEGVSVYELNKHGEPMDPDPHMMRGQHEHDDWCDDDCDQDFDSDYGNDTAEEMRGRASRAERNRYNGQDRDHETGHLVKGEMVGIGHDGEPLLQKVRRVGDWINDRHKFIPTAEPHRLAEYDFDRHAAISTADDPSRWDYNQKNWDSGFHSQYLDQSKQAGDYMLHAEQPDEDGYRTIHAVTHDGQYVGNTFFGPHPHKEGFQEGAPQVHPQHRRRGLGTAMYDYAEELGGKPMAPALEHTEYAAAFWRDRMKRQGAAGEPATGEPDPEATTSACSYCGSSDLQTAGDNGRNVQVRCLDCGGMMSSNGGQLQPELIGDPSNHPSGAPDLRAQTNGGVPPVRRMNPSDASTTFTAARSVDWDTVGAHYPHLYGDPEVHGEAADGADGWAIGDAANYLAHSRPGDEHAENASVHDLEFHPEYVAPHHIDYVRHPPNDPRVAHAIEGYKNDPSGRSVPPLVLVHRHGVYHVADGHHRAAAAANARVEKVPALVAYSPHPDEPFGDGGHGPSHGAVSTIKPETPEHQHVRDHLLHDHGAQVPSYSRSNNELVSKHERDHWDCPHEFDRETGNYRTASLRIEASDEHDYRMMHQAPDADYGAPLHDVENMMPDFYNRPHLYNHGQDHFWDSANKVMKAQGKPEHKVRIYRALPAEHAGKGFNTGDWVTTSKEYARLHGKHYQDSKHDMPVISTVVPAKHLHTEGDIHEWAYNGPSTSDASVAFKGGYHQEIRQHADGSIAPVQRKANPFKEREKDLKDKGYSFSHYRPTSEDNPDHTIVAYDHQDNWAGQIKANRDGEVHHTEIDPHHAHEPLEEHMRDMLTRNIKKRGPLEVTANGTDWCTHRRDGRCTHPLEDGLVPRMATPQDRGPCAWNFWQQQVCPISEPGPMALMQAKGSIKEGELDTEGLWHFTAAWSDVRAKAKRLRTEGAVRITVASTAGVGGEVKGDHNVYETALNFVPGSQKVGYWTCGCKWSAYAWGRSPAYKRFEGRMCSHALAMQFEAQARGMFGQTVMPDVERPKWLKPHTPVVIQHERDTHNDLTRRAVPPGNMRRTYEGSMSFEAFMSQQEFAQNVMAEFYRLGGADPEPLEIQRMLDKVRDEEHEKHQDDNKYAENYHPLAQSDIPAEHMKGWRFQQNLQEAGGASFFDKDDHEARKEWSSAHEPPVNVSTYRHPVSREHLYLDDQGRAWARHTGPRNEGPTDEHRLPRFTHWSGPHKASEVLENHPVWSQYDDESGQRKWRWASHNERLKLTGTRPDESAHDVTLRRNRQLREDGWNVISSLSPAHDLVQSSLELGAEPVAAMRMLLTAGLEHQRAKEILREVLAAEAHIASTHTAMPSRKHIPPADLSFDTYSPTHPYDPYNMEGEETHPGWTHHLLRAHRPEPGMIGMIYYSRTPEGAEHPGVAVHDMKVYGDENRGQGIASAMQDELRRQHPNHMIDHGSRTLSGHGWASQYDDPGDPRLDLSHPDNAGKEHLYRPTELAHELAGKDLTHLGVKEVQGPTHAGVVLKAADTGRVLMLQRNLEDESDPAAGCWEFPGGGIEEGDETSLHAAIREWEEEVGQQFPQGGAVHHVWASPNGVYHGHVVVIPEERQVELHHGRVIPNPDDPDGETAEQAAWWTVEHAKKNPALRPECRTSPWKEIAKAGIGKEAASWDSLEEFNPGTTPPQHSLSQNPASTGFATSEDPDSWEHLGETSSLSPSGVYAMLHLEPEPALPSTDGADDAPTTDQETMSFGYDDLTEFREDHPAADPRADMHSEIGMLDQSYTPSPVHGSLQGKGSVADIVAQFQATAAAKALATPDGESSEDVAQAAQEFLKKQALKDFNFHEQQELINEGAQDNTMARNVDVLKIEGTHYAALEEALAAEEALKDPDDLFA